MDFQFRDYSKYKNSVSKLFSCLGWETERLNIPPLRMLETQKATQRRYYDAVIITKVM